MLNLRRLTMLFMAMFVIEQQWLQLHLFIALNFLAISYVVIIKPFEKQELNVTNGLNETVGLFVAYLLLPMQDLRIDPVPRYDHVGEAIVFVLQTSAILNLLVILGRTVYDSQRNLRRAYNKKIGVCFFRDPMKRHKMCMKLKYCGRRRIVIREPVKRDLSQ